MKSIRKYRTGDILLEFGKKLEDKEALCNKLQVALGEDIVTIKQLKVKTAFEIRDFIKKFVGDTAGALRVSLTKDKEQRVKYGHSPARS